MKGVFLVRRLDRFKDFRRFDQGPSVDLLQLVAPHTVPLGIEVVEVREAIAKRVAQLEVGFGQAGENIGRHDHVLAEIHRGDPQPQDLRAVRLDDFVRVDPGAERLRHGAALGVEHPARCHHLLVRGRAARAQRQQQRALEPAPVLVAALEIEVRGPGKVRPAPEHRQVTRSRIEPHVEDVLLLSQPRFAALGTLRARARQVLDRVRVPGVGAFPAEQLDGGPRHLRVEQRRGAGLTIEDRDRDAPYSLP